MSPSIKENHNFGELQKTAIRQQHPGLPKSLKEHIHPYMGSKFHQSEHGIIFLVHFTYAPFHKNRGWLNASNQPLLYLFGYFSATLTVGRTLNHFGISSIYRIRIALEILKCLQGNSMRISTEGFLQELVRFRIGPSVFQVVMS